MNKIFTALIVLSAVFAFTATVKCFDNPKNMHVLIVGSPNTGISAVAERLASKGVILVVESDSDGIGRNRAALPPIINKNGLIPIATAEQTLIAVNFDNFESKPPDNSINHTNKIFYDLPPNDFGYNGESFANLTRDRTRRI